MVDCPIFPTLDIPSVAPKYAGVAGEKVVNPDQVELQIVARMQSLKRKIYAELEIVLHLALCQLMVIIRLTNFIGQILYL